MNNFSKSNYTYTTVLSDTDEQGVCSIRLNRPQSLNAMNRQLIDDLAKAFEDANANPAAKAIILTGEGRAFCAGDDRVEHVHPENEAAAQDLVDAIQRVTRAMVLGEKPIVGAINGWAVGGGFEWAINCDFSIWAKSAKAFFPEVSLNLFVTGAVTSLLPALVGLNKAKEMLFLGQHYQAEQLAQMGVAWRVVEDHELLEQAYALATQLAQLPILSVRAMKRVLNQTASADLETALKLETEATVTGFMDPHTTELLLKFNQ
ncbi:MAG TPA: enoyl-CoA hydratase/isomerase family protein [Oceanospirillaceae bacterium]|nr:enoyl-CoA hydratase/isomerase family protein [Oceanospirillaceae bacterium]